MRTGGFLALSQTLPVAMKIFLSQEDLAQGNELQQYAKHKHEE